MLNKELGNLRSFLLTISFQNSRRDIKKYFKKQGTHNNRRTFIDTLIPLNINPFLINWHKKSFLIIYFII